MALSTKETLQKVAIAAAFIWLGWRVVARYSPGDDSPYPDNAQGFSEATVAFLRAGKAMDSVALRGMDISPAAQRWVLDQARLDPDFLSALAKGLFVLGIRRSFDFREVTFTAKNLTRCQQSPLTVRFTGLPTARHISEVESTCTPP